ncbi:MAG: hypothetical protein AAGE94_21920 [Acidobacteriota bacterium]
MSNAPDPSFSPALKTGLQEAVERLREKVDAVYRDASESEKMADLHYLAHELVDQQVARVAEADPSLEDGALLDLRERVGRHVHRLIEATRRPS